MNEEPLSNREKSLYEQLSKEAQPPKELEQKIIKNLHHEGLLDRKPRRNTLPWAVSIAASIAFIAGIFFEKINSKEAIQINPEKGYMLILHQDDNFHPNDPTEMFEEYSRWTNKTKEAGFKITGQELKNKTIIVDKDGVSLINTSQITSGYFILEAASIEQALGIAKENPHVKYGGTIEVKSFMTR